jgi:hypothetical protein
MSSNFIYQLRRYSGDPLAVRLKNISETLAAFEAQQVQIEASDILNSIRSDNSVDQYKELAFTKVKPVSTTFFIPFEPDLNLLKIWYKFDAWGKITRDASFQGNPGAILGQTPTAAIGPDKGYGTGTIAMAMDGLTQFIEITDNANIQLVGQAVGFSVAFLINPSTFALTTSGESRYVVEKADNPTNLWAVLLDTTGKIHFNIKFGGVDYSKSTTTGALALNTWSWVMITFNASTHAAVIYINGVSQTLSADTITDTDFTNVKTNMYVGSTAVNDGFFAGPISDFRYYRERILTAGECTNLNTNMITISSIAFGRVAIVGMSLIST